MLVRQFIIIVSLFSSAAWAKLLGEGKNFDRLEEPKAYENYCDQFQKKFDYADKDIAINDKCQSTDSTNCDSDLGHLELQGHDISNFESYGMTFGTVTLDTVHKINKIDFAIPKKQRILDISSAPNSTTISRAYRDTSITSYSATGIFSEQERVVKILKKTNYIVKNPVRKTTEITNFAYVNDKCFPSSFILKIEDSTGINMKSFTHLDFCIDYDNYRKKSKLIEADMKKCLNIGPHETAIAQIFSKHGVEKEYNALDVKWSAPPKVCTLAQPGAKSHTDSYYARGEELYKNCKDNLPNYSQLQAEYVAAKYATPRAGKSIQKQSVRTQVAPR